MHALLIADQAAGGAPIEQGDTRRTLLVVDDDEGPRQALLVLFRNDYNVLLADSGIKAIEIVQLNPVDVVVLDIRMAVLSGIEVLSQLKRMDPTIEVIMLTAYETLETAREALRLGACDYLSKPFDITVMRQSVAKAMARRTLSAAIRAQSDKLSQLQEEMQHQRIREEMARTRGDIYASIIHDINGPLTIISGFLQMANQNITSVDFLEGEQLRTVREHLGRISQQVDTCIQVCRRYLSFLRETGPETRSVSINLILSDLRELLKAHSEARRNRLSIEPCDEGILAQVNGTDLIQILLNLTVNAFQCSEWSHEVKVSCQVVDKALDLEACTNSGNKLFVNLEGLDNTAPLLALSVEDNGPGIPSEILSQIFAPYFTTKPEGEGTGLGLAIVRRLVERARGAIRVQTELGKGTVFTVYFRAIQHESPRLPDALPKED